MGDHAWIIADDFLAEPGDRKGELAGNCTGITGPDGAPERLLRRLRDGEGDKFALFDDDGIIYYAGRALADGGTDGEDGFAPLDELGRPNAGAVLIKYKRGDVWETL